MIFNTIVSGEENSVQTAHISLHPVSSDQAYWTDSTFTVRQAEIDFDTGQIFVDGDSPIGTIVVVNDMSEPYGITGLTLIETFSSRPAGATYVYEVTG